MISIRLKSPAKLNLYLRIIDKRPDGYHNIVTLFERINLFDDITLGPALKGIKISCTDPRVPLGPRNLTYKAAKALLDYTGAKKGVCISIKKRIPAASGLGGGSSNAASVLLGLNQLWGLRLGKRELLNLGKKIGADVNFFLADKSFAIATGIGDNIKPVNTGKKTLWHVLIAKKSGLSTKEVYKQWDAGKGKKIGLTGPLDDVKIILHAIKKNNLFLLGKGLHNDLEAPAILKDKTIIQRKLLLYNCLTRAVLMSGSGGAVFCVANSRKEAIALRDRILRGICGTFLRDKWQIFVARTW